jgi:mannose-6-phosphate isomerase-like protein (cupin superfamily)
MRARIFLSLSLLPLLLALGACGHAACTEPAHAESSEAAADPAQPAAAAQPPAVLDALFPSGRITQALDALAASAQLEPNEAFRITEIGRDASSSHHLVLLRDREPVHRHDTHDLLVVVLDGQGSMLIGNEERPVGPHSVIYIPRGTPHSMRNTSGRPSAAYAMFVPAFDGKDRVPVEAPAAAQP